MANIGYPFLVEPFLVGDTRRYIALFNKLGFKEGGALYEGGEETSIKGKCRWFYVNLEAKTYWRGATELKGKVKKLVFNEPLDRVDFNLILLAYLRHKGLIKSDIDSIRFADKDKGSDEELELKKLGLIK